MLNYLRQGIFNKRKGPSVDYRPVLRTLVKAINRNTDAIYEGVDVMALNFERVSLAIDQVSTGINSVAEAIRRLPAPNPEDQAALDALAARLEGLVVTLDESRAAEDAEDNVPVPEPEPEPTE